MYKRVLGLLIAGMSLVVILEACGDATKTATTSSSGSGAATATTSNNSGAMPGMTMKPGETSMAGTSTTVAASSTTSVANTTKTGATANSSTTTSAAATTAMAGMTSAAADVATPGNDAMTNSLKGLSGKEFEVMFMQEMMVHHQSAIDMAKLVPTNTKRPELIKLSQDIVTAQSKEITDMTGWLASWYNAKPLSDSMSVPGMMEMIGDMDKLKNAKGDAFNKQFITMMVSHHQQAVSMASLLPSKPSGLNSSNSARISSKVRVLKSSK